MTPAGEILDTEHWQQRREEWLPSAEDEAYVESLMVQVREPGAFASWIAPPRIGINNQPIDYPYVRM